MTRLLLFLFFQLVGLGAIAATFTVTTNADTGPGSLRQALANAGVNGSAVKDVIIFNIPDQSQAGRTITLKSGTLIIPANTDVDGTTQPGSRFGVSDAKIKITLSVSDVTSLALVMFDYAASNINVYGLWLSGNWRQVNSGAQAGVTVNGINIYNGSNINIGAPGKGNLIENCVNGLYIFQASAVTIQSNIFGVVEDGVTPSLNDISIECQKTDNLTIGGNLQNMGNVFDSFASAVEFIANTNVLIAYNLIGTDVTGNVATHGSYIGTTTYSNGLYATGGSNYTISNNLISGIGDAIILNNVTQAYTITNNIFGTGLTANVNLGNRTAIFIGETTASGLIAFNTFYYNGECIYAKESNAVTVTKNIFDCNVSADDIDYAKSLVTIPEISLGSKTSTQVSGTATPNTQIELFYSDDCGCEPKTYITTIQADNLGKWSYSAALSAKWILASATDQNGSTSPFSSLKIDESGVMVNDVTCGDTGNGSITKISYKNAKQAYWTKLDDGTVYQQNDILFVPPGKYQFTATTVDCTVTSKIYEVRDKRVLVDTNHVSIANAQCGLPTGSISGVVITNHAPSFTATWRDESNKVIGDSVRLSNVKSGKYSLVIASPNGACPQLFYFTINNSTELIYTPNADNVLACSPGDAVITVNNPASGYGYHLYEDELSNSPIADAVAGKFKVNVKNTHSYYVTQYKGTCESSRIKVDVTLLSNALNIANTFSPNGDGVNDTWKIGSIENYPNANIQLFTRSGEKVYESTNYANPFNGTYKGRPLLVGVYYYIINLKVKACGFLSGNLTLIR